MRTRRDDLIMKRRVMLPALAKSLSAYRWAVSSRRASSRTIHSHPLFPVWAMQDPLDAPLQRIQMVKGWIDESGETHEKVIDIACADDLPLTQAPVVVQTMVRASI